MTSQAQHTPGPWTVTFVHAAPVKVAPVVGFKVTAGDESKWHSVTSQNAYEDKNNACYSAAEIEANARLIAAAPELLEALQKIGEVCGRDEFAAHRIARIESVVRAVIRKATEP